MNNRPNNDIKARIRQLLKGVIDPELMVNIIDLGLVYDIRISKDTPAIAIDMTLSSPGCPLGDVIMEDVRLIIARNFPDYEVKVNLTWDPPWTADRITPAGREALNNR